MKTARFTAVLLLALLAGAGSAMPQEQHPWPGNDRGWQGQGEPRGGNGGGHMGDWLRNHRSLPPAEQQRELQSDPGFRRLPPDRQEQLRERLQKFNNLPPDRQNLMLQRMDTFNRLSPAQKDRARDAFAQFRGLPEDRRHMVAHAFHDLQGLSPQQRQQVLNSPSMRGTFSDQERNMLRSMTDLNLGPGPGQTSGHPGTARPMGPPPGW